MSQTRSFASALLAFAALAGATLCALGALAHHPGSHAFRQGERVRLEAATLATDGCTFIGSITTGAPPGYAAPAGSAAVTMRLRRPADAQLCTAQVRMLKDEVMLDVPRGTGRFHLFVLKPDGSLQATERVPIN